MIAVQIRELINKVLAELDITAGEFVVEHPADLAMGDYSTNVGIKTGKAREILDALQNNLPDEIERVEIAGPGFINFYLSRKFVDKNLSDIADQGEMFGRSEHAKGYRVMVEHTQPNPFKEFHIGHLMNNSVGEAVSRIVKANGAEVKTASYHGDIGLHVAKAIWGKLDKSDLSWGEAYAHGAQHGDENEIVEVNKKIYDKSDEKINALYAEGRSESLQKFEELYEKLNSSFDFHFYESESGELGKEIVNQNIGKIFEESEGAVVFKGENFEPKTHTRVFLNKNGLPTYEAKEVGLAQIKSEQWSFDQAITITANEQDSFFKVVEVAIGEVFPNLKGKISHLSHGMLKLPTGKMSSRTGDVITAESLIETVKGKTQGKEDVAIGAIKYMILRQSIGHDIIFDLDKSVSTEGDSGVYLQYALARSNSILEKAGDNMGGDSSGEISTIERMLYRFPEVVERAGKDFAPNYITTYLTELASAFNNFYAQGQIVGDAHKVAVTRAFNIVMKNGLTILGIPTPDRV